MKHGSKIKALALPVCWARGHRPEGESIIETQSPETNFIKRCSRCGRYILRTRMGEMTLSKKAALRAKSKYEKALEFPTIGTEVGHV
jgi:hypothetical protein